MGNHENLQQIWSLENKKQISESTRLEKNLNTVIEKKFKDFPIEQKITLNNLIKKLLSYNSENITSQWKKIWKIFEKCGNSSTKIIKALQEIIKNQEYDKNNLPWKRLFIDQNSFNETVWETQNNIKTAEKVKESYTKLNPKFKQATPQQIQQTQKAISPENQRKLKKAGIQPQEYAQFLLTKEAIFQHDEKTPETREFLDALKKLESSLGLKTDRIWSTFQIDRTTPSEHPHITQYAKTAPELKKFENSISREGMSREDHFDLVEKFGSNELKEKQIKIKSLIQNGVIQTQNPEDKALAISYAQEVKQLKNDLQNFTSDIQKFSTSYAPIPILASCLDRSSINTFSLAEIRKKSKEKPISTIRQEGKDDIMEIQGSIEKNPIRFFYNLSNPNASLQSDDHFSFDSVNKQMLIGNQERTSLNIELPTIKTIQETMEKETPPELLQQLLQNSADKEEYFTKLNEHIQSIFEQNFHPSEEVKSRICLRTEKNLTSQVFSSELFPDHLKDQLQDPRLINNTPELKKLFHLLDLSLENSTTDQIQSLRKGLKKLRNLTNNQDQINKVADPVLKNQLQKLYSSFQNGSSLSNWTQNMLNFFNLFIKKDLSSEKSTIDTKNPSEQKINPYHLEDFLNLSTFDQAPTQQQRESLFSREFNQKYMSSKEKLEEQASIAEKRNILDIESELEMAFENPNYNYAYA